jgi:membrane-associated phospholipid phosphatase
MEQGQSQNRRVSKSARTALASGLAAAALALIPLTYWAAQAQPAPFDLAVRDAVHAHSSPILTAAMKTATLVGSAYGIVPAMLMAAALLVRRGRRRAALLLVVATAGSELLGELLKFAVHSPRPVPFFGLATPWTPGFPSTHAMTSASFCGALAAIFSASVHPAWKRRLLWATAAATSLTIGFSRVYLGVHYPSDVLGGYAAAVVWGSALSLVIKRFTRNEHPN